MLAAASGDILDDEELINALSRSKVTSEAINKRLVEAETTTLGEPGYDLSTLHYCSVLGIAAY